MRHHSQVYAFKTAHIDGHCLATITRLFAYAERCASAIGAEMMLDEMLAESVGGEGFFSISDVELLSGREPQQVAFAAADGAITFHCLAGFDVHLVGNATAMTAAFVVHETPRLVC